MSLCLLSIYGSSTITTKTTRYRLFHYLICLGAAGWLAIFSRSQRRACGVGTLQPLWVLPMSNDNQFFFTFFKLI